MSFQEVKCEHTKETPLRMQTLCYEDKCLRNIALHHYEHFKLCEYFESMNKSPLLTFQCALKKRNQKNSVPHSSNSVSEDVVLNHTASSITLCALSLTNFRYHLPVLWEHYRQNYSPAFKNLAISLRPHLRSAGVRAR